MIKYFNKLDVVLAIILLIGFFLPLGKGFFFTDSGYGIGREMGGETILKWAIPAAAFVLIILALINLKNKVAIIITGLLPFAIVTISYIEIGKELFSGLTYGAYITLIVGILLILFGAGIINSAPTMEVEEVT